jgi:uncharacterized membrane protein (UPF0127 family)
MTARQCPDNKLTVLVTIIFLVGVISCTNLNAQDQHKKLSGFDVSELQIMTQDERQLRFTVYLATSKEQRAQGLSFVTDLPSDYGMLFVFPEIRRINMWMKDTPSSLDMLFIDNKGKIAKIVSDTTPNSTAIITSGDEASAVLEVNAGTARRLGIVTGDRVDHPLLNSRRSDMAEPKK